MLHLLSVDFLAFGTASLICVDGTTRYAFASAMMAHPPCFAGMEATNWCGWFARLAIELATPRKKLSGGGANGVLLFKASKTRLFLHFQRFGQAYSSDRACMHERHKEIGCKSDAYACSHAPPGDVDLDVAVVGEQH